MDENKQVLEHARLSASGAKRWLACPPSVVMEESMEEKKSIYAEEGSLAHKTAECWLKGYGEEDVVFHDLYTPEMGEYAKGYAEYCKSLGGDQYIEQRIDFSRWVPDGFGTSDFISVSDGMLEVVDFKYGKGVYVSAEDNPQMKLYALGAYDTLRCLYDIRSVRMTIVQPRMDNISSCELVIEDLLAWGESIKPIALQAYKGEGEFASGEHCQFCKAKRTCKARSDENLQTVFDDFKENVKVRRDFLTDDELLKIYERIDDILAWAKDIKEYVYDKALQGKPWKGYKLVEGRSVRKYRDESEAIHILKDAGYDEAVLFEKNLLGITDMEKLLGKKRFNELLSDAIVKPSGKPALVPVTDKRAELNSAVADFTD